MDLGRTPRSERFLFGRSNDVGGLVMPIYLDANASSRLRPEAQAAVQGLLTGGAMLRNPSSVHTAGRNARGALMRARRQLVELLAGNTNKSLECVFTSGGTEACNAMIFGFLGDKPAGHIVCSTIEHPAVLEAVERLELNGLEVTLVGPGPDGIVAVNDVCSAVRKDTALVTLMAANNETGAVQPVRELATKLRAQGFAGVIVSDCTQALGKVYWPMAELLESGVNAFAISGHKIGALPGVGALIYDNENICFPYQPLIVGGPQEKRLRAGSENVAGIVSFGAAAAAVQHDLRLHIEDLHAFREFLWDGLEAVASNVVRLTPSVSDPLSPTAAATCNTLLVRMLGCRGDDLVAALDIEGVMASTGAACASGKQEVSHVARAMGLTEAEGRECVRFSLDWDADDAALEEAVRRIAVVVERMRETPQDLIGAVQ